MCGIAGVFDYTQRDSSPVDREQAVDMVDSLAHRGPDDGGVWIAPGIMLGHRRLSILDISHDGHQPMWDARTGCGIVYNGEVYNYRELRHELCSLGHQFRSATDTEVILRGYTEWGVDVVHRLNGMFAWAIYDPKKESLWIVRDGVGIKPLFVHDDGQRIWFASEIKALLRVCPHLAKPDRQGLSGFLAFGYTPSPRTGFQGISQLQPGEAWWVCRGKSVVRATWYRMPYPSSPHDCSLADATERLDTALNAAVARQLVSDVPVGAMLSGGLDSSAIVRSMRHQNANIESFSAGFTEATFDERSFARQVAARYQTHHREVTIAANAHDVIHRIVSHAEEPLADNSAIPLYFLSEFMRRSVTVALNGDGADELLAGYDTYRASQLAPYIRRCPRWIRHLVLKPAVQVLPNSVAKYNTKMLLGRFLTGAEHDSPRDHSMWRSMVSPELRCQLFRPEFLSIAGDPWQDFASVLDTAPDGLTPLERQLHMDFRFHLPNGLLVKSDRMSMAHGLEVRVPWLDQETVAACLAIPPQLKRQGNNGKRVLKEMLARDLPREITHRRKEGFLAPIEAWLKYAWQPMLRSHLTEQFAEETGMFRWPVLSQMLDDHRSKKVDHAYALYAILVLSLWWETWINRKRPPLVNRPRNAAPTTVDSFHNAT
ncbi:MAG: asparagine synthase (glutamine-hydrolyzing) [Pirellula sp.]